MLLSVTISTNSLAIKSHRFICKKPFSSNTAHHQLIEFVLKKTNQRHWGLYRKSQQDVTIDVMILGLH